FWCFLFFFGSSSFLFRLQLLRPHLISIIGLLLFVYWFFFRKNYLGIFLFSFLLVVFHHFPYPLPFVIFADFLGTIILKQKIVWKNYLIAALGTLAGFSVLPHPLIALKQMFWVFRITQLVNSKNIDLHFGLELYPNINQLFLAILVPLAILSFLLPTLFLKRKNFKIANRLVAIKFFLLFILLGALSIKSMRFVEYLFPLLLILVAYTLNYLTPHFLKYRDKNIKNKMRLLIITFLVFISFFNFLQFHKSITRKDKDSLISAAIWINKNTLQGSRIFHSSWGDFPILFLGAPNNQYILAADPISLYLSNEQLYWLWYNIGHCGLPSLNTKVCDSLILDSKNWDILSAGYSAKDIHTTIKNNFSSEYVFLSNWQESFLEQKIKQNQSLFQEKFKNDLVKIYQIK
ncbi:MAG: hypothetical protein PHT36_02790, partial [Patescibacteria group bacterium]|nr:hypothetical protein [Patescibacteria group bacterium]